MITIRRSEHRHRNHRRQQTDWLTFYPRDREDPSGDRFGTLESLGEHRLPPSAPALPQVHHEAEIITYVREGALRYGDSNGGTGVLQAGEFQRVSCAGAIRRSETNASRNHWAHTFHIWLCGVRGKVLPDEERRSFGRADRRGSLCLVASPDARDGSMKLHQDASLFSSLLEPGHHLFHELLPGRGAWLHLVAGEATLGDSVLTTGDGAGIVDERAISFTAQEKTEVLLLDLQLPPTAYSGQSGHRIRGRQLPVVEHPRQFEVHTLNRLLTCRGAKMASPARRVGPHALPASAARRADDVLINGIGRRVGAAVPVVFGPAPPG